MKQRIQTNWPSPKGVLCRFKIKSLFYIRVKTNLRAWQKRIGPSYNALNSSSVLLTLHKISAVYAGLLSHPVNDILTSTRFTDSDNFSINLLVISWVSSNITSQFDTELKLKVIFSAFLRILTYQGHSYSLFASTLNTATREIQPPSTLCPIKEPPIPTACDKLCVPDLYKFPFVQPFLPFHVPCEKS